MLICCAGLLKRVLVLYVWEIGLHRPSRASDWYSAIHVLTLCYTQSSHCEEINPFKNRVPQVDPQCFLSRCC